MPVVDSFSAYDEHGIEYKVVTNEIKFSHLVGGVQSVYDYSLVETGEVLRRVPDEPGFFKIPSTGVNIVDSRNL